ncbi:MAG TPA: hypothetical protein PKX06_05100, partial [Phenylobacterium sp.]|nr:hypothetical protein [Phenylobacterium sp.]
MSSSHASGAIASGLLRQLLAGTAAVALTAGAAHAQTPPPAVDPYGDEDTEVEELVVTAGVRTLRGSVAGDIAPEVTLSAREIRAYGASSVSELLEA